jgi:hypothetical protein
MYSVNGYRRYSRDVDNAFNIIPSDRISMKGVDFPVIGVDEFGIIQFMQPEKEYQFPGNTVFEVPIKQAGGSHNAQSQTKKPVTQTNDKRDYIAENNVSYQWSDAPINTTPLLIPSAYKTTQGGSDSEIKPIEEQLRLAKLALETLDSAYEDQLRALYNTTPHQVLYKYDKDYRNRMDYNASQNPYKIQYPKTDLRRGDNIPPNTAWMYPNLTGQIGAAMTTQANQDLAFDIMGAGMASKYFKDAKGVNDIAKVFKPAKRVDDIAKVSKPGVGKPAISLIKKGYKEIPKENSNPYGYMRRIFNPPVDELGQKLKFSVPSKIKNSETYRVMTTADTEHLLSTGKFKTSLPIEQDVKFMEELKTTNPERYKAIKYAENSRNYTRVTPDKNYAEMHYFDDLINPSDKGNIVTLKPLKNRIFPSTEVGGYNELFAKDLTIDDVLHIKDRNGKIIYQSPNSKNSFKSEIDWIKPVSKGKIKAFTTIPIGIGTAGTVGASQQKYEQGGTVGMDGMMKARLALDSHFGNPTARRMTNYDTRNYKFDDGSIGNVYVSSYDNLVTPHIQLDENNNLIYVDDVWSDNNKERSYQQSMKFEREEDAEYFGKNYKRVAPMKKLYQKQVETNYINSKKKKENIISSLRNEQKKDTCDTEQCATYISNVTGLTVLGNAWTMKNDIEKK